MKFCVSIFLILSLEFVSGDKNRRILHQKLFPSNSAPTLRSGSPPPIQDLPDPDQPFFHELPTGPTGVQGSQVPSTMSANTTVSANPGATKPSNSRKKIGIAISSGVLTLGMLCALAFFLYKQRSKQHDESQKLVDVNSQRINEESRIPPSTFLYIGTVEPSTRSLVNETNDTCGSPYQKLKSGERFDRYRPSPEFQPLPPLTKPPLPPTINSSPHMSSSDDESHETKFYTPQGSSVSNESPGTRHSHMGKTTSQLNQSKQENQSSTVSIPHSKRTSPKSRLSASSPDKKLVMIPSIKQSLPPSPSPTHENSSLGSLQPSKVLPFTPKWPVKFSAPPPPPDITRLQSINSCDNQTCKIPVPPSPPPPISLSASGILATRETYAPFQILKSVTRQQEKNSSSKTSQGTEKSKPVEGKCNGLGSLEKHESDEKEGKPKLKPLHWDKVRATSDRATVWDHLKSNSFQLNEDAMESLFGCNSVNSVTKDSSKKLVIPSLEQENRVLHPKKSQNIAILLRALNVTTEEVCDALLDGNPEELGSEILETLVKMAPTKEEEIKLKDFDEGSSRLGSAEIFLKAILNIPFSFKRAEMMLYRANFNSEVHYHNKIFVPVLPIVSDQMIRNMKESSRCI